MSIYGGGFIPIIIYSQYINEFIPPPGSFFMITEDSDYMITEDDDRMVTE